MRLEIILFILLTVLIKLTPHIPHANPELVFSLYFLKYYPRLTATMAIMLTWLIGDLSYAWFYHTSAFGGWSLFNYSALAFFIWIYSAYPTQKSSMYLGVNSSLTRIRGVHAFLTSNHLLWVSMIASLLFWLWSNLGVWLISGIYPHTLTGFIHCYVLALPFLYDAELAAVGWASALTLMRRTATQEAPSHFHQTR